MSFPELCGKKTKIATGPHLALAYGLVSRLEELHQRTGGRTDLFSDVSDGFLMGEHTCPERGVRKRECIMRGRVAFRRKPFRILNPSPGEPGVGLRIPMKGAFRTIEQLRAHLAGLITYVT